VSSRPVGASARNTSEQLVSVVNFAKLRAQATRRTHRIQVEPQRVSVWESSSTSLIPAAAPAWTLVQTTQVPVGVRIWNATAGPTIALGAAPAEDTALLYALDVRADGQATGTTMWVTDNVHNYRVITYHVTGGTYAREFW
jgi:hypothetical protein